MVLQSTALRVLNMKKISCIICAYNEAPRIKTVLSAVANHPLIDEVVVVDDGSTDETVAVVSEFPTIKLISLPQNVGKSKAMAEGVKAVSHDLLMLVDADLVGLDPEDISTLANPVLSGQADVSISLRKDSFVRLMGLDFVTGERVVPRALLADVTEDIEKLPSFGIEVFMNQLIIENNLRVAVVDWKSVRHTRKVDKWGWPEGLFDFQRMVADILDTVHPSTALAQTYQLLALRSDRAEKEKPLSEMWEKFTQEWKDVTKG